MKKLFFFPFLLLIHGLASASTIFSYTVVTKANLTAECSDFLGKTAVGGNAYFRDFLIEAKVQTGCPLEVGGHLKMLRGSVSDGHDFSCARASSSEIQDTGMTSVLSYDRSLDDFTNEMDSTSLQLLNTKDLTSNIKVRHLTQNDLRSSSTLVLETEKDQILVLNIAGKDLVIEKINIVLKGAAKPSTILWNFYEAKNVVMKFSGVKADQNGESVGVPGTILAPYATVKMNNIRVTGALFANQYFGTADSETCDGLVSGQVNPDCFKAPVFGIGCLPRRHGGKGQL
jgi:hypothetical protein